MPLRTLPASTGTGETAEITDGGEGFNRFLGFAPFDRLRAGRTGIEQGISNYEVEIASSAIGGLAMTNFRIDSSASLGMTVAIAEHSEIFLSGVSDCRIGYRLHIGWALL